MKRPRLTDAQREEIARLRGELGWSPRRIARHLGRSPGAVAWWCLVGAIEKPGPVQVPAPWTGPMVVKRGAFEVRRFTADEDRQLIAMEAEGLKLGTIARRLGRRRNSVYGRLATPARREERALALISAQESADA